MFVKGTGKFLITPDRGIEPLARDQQRNMRRIDGEQISGDAGPLDLAVSHRGGSVDGVRGGDHCLGVQLRRQTGILLAKIESAQRDR